MNCRVLAVILLLLPFQPASLKAGIWFISPYALENATRDYWGDNVVTSTHECTHAVNSYLRQRYGGQCFYVGENRFARFKKTGLRLSQVAARIRHRGDIHNLYLIQQQADWEDTALYLFDEWSAYINGATIAVYNRPPPRDGWSTIAFACEMGYYCGVLLQLLPDDYSQARELKTFFNWQANRCLRIAEDAERTGANYNPRQRIWRVRLRQMIRR